MDRPLCIGTARRKRGKPGPCAQRALMYSDFCWYHQPDHPERKFGVGYNQLARQEYEREVEWAYAEHTAIYG